MINLFKISHVYKMGEHKPYRANTGIYVECFTVRRSVIYLLVACLLGLAAVGAYIYFEIFGSRDEVAA